MTRFPIVALTFALCLAGAARAAGTPPIQVQGALDLDLHAGRDALAMNGLAVGDSPYDDYRLRIFLQAEVSPTLQVYAQSLLDEYHYELVEGAYGMYTPWKDRDLHLLAGKVPTVVGTWEPRGNSRQNPLIGTPLIYGYYTSLSRNRIPGSVDALLGAAGDGASGPDYGSGGYGPGLAIVWDGWWDAGVTAEGSLRPFEFAVSASQGTPSTPSPGYDESPGNSWLGRIGIAPSPAFRAGVSGSTGPYLPTDLASALPAGRSIEDFRQQLAMADAEYLAGPVELRGEAALNAWQTPTVGTLRVRGGYAEARVAIGASTWVAARAEGLRFSHVQGSGAAQPWDDDVDRLSAGLGYRIDRGALAKLELQRSRLHEADGVENYDQIALQLALRF